MSFLTTFVKGFAGTWPHGLDRLVGPRLSSRSSTLS